MQAADAYKKQKKIILTILFITWVINYLDKLAINIAIIPISDQFNINETQTGLVISVFFVGYAIMQLVGGWLTDKYGSRKLILFAVFFWSVFTILTSFAWSLISLIFIRLLFGFAEGAFPPANALAIAENFPKKERGRAKATLTSATTIGSILSAIISAAFINMWGWRGLFIVFGLIGFVLFYFLFKHLPARKDTPTEPDEVKVPLKSLYKSKFVWQLMLMYFGVSTVTWGITSWMPTYLVKEKGMDILSMGSVSIIPALVGFISILCTGWLIDKVLIGKEKYLIIIGSLISGLCIYLMANATTIPMIVLYQSITSLGTLMAATTVLTMPLKYISQNVIGSATGLMTFGGQVAGALTPTIMGLLITLFNGSYNAAFIYLMVAMVIPVVVAIVLKPSKATQPTKEELVIQNA